jgi:PrtD family type I secretion system ABC transporter
MLLGLMLLSELSTRRLLAQASEQTSANLQRAESIIRNAPTFQAMGMGPHVLEYWLERDERAQASATAGQDRAAWISSISRSTRFLVQVFVYAIGAYLILDGQLTGGAMIACAVILGRAMAPIEQLTGAWRNFVSARDAYRRLTTTFARLPQESASMLLPPPKGRLNCEDLLFVPPGRQAPALVGISFAIDPGVTLGVVGPSGAGKSTLCKLLAGIQRPSRGHVRLDGVDVFEWAPERLGPHVGYTAQSNELFEGPVQRIIARMAPTPDAELVLEAATLAGAHETIITLPHGYDTEIGPGGFELSAGQRQRVALARAFYGRPQLLILDEPNANLDAAGEAALLRGIERARGWGATIVVVAHQRGVLRLVDNLLILKAGRMEAFGPRDVVLAKLGAAPVRPLDKTAASNIVPLPTPGVS